MKVLILLAIAFTLLGSKGCNSTNQRVVCQGFNYPLCRDVSWNYPCLCLSSPNGLSAAQAEDLRRVQ